MTTVSPTFGVMFRRERSPEELAPFARFVETAGLDELWIVEDCFWAGGLTTVTAALAVTERLSVALGIAPVVVRNPAIVAMEMAGIARMYPDRFIAGFGHGVGDWMRQIGAFPASQLAAFDETVDAVRRLLDGESVTVHGRHVHLDDVKLVFPPVSRPPIVAGVLGPKSIDVTARVADGLMLPEGSSAEYIAAANRRQGAGRPCAVYVLFAVHDDRDVAREQVRASVDEFAPGDGDGRLALLTGNVGEIAVVDRISRFAAAGTPADCASAIDALIAAGATSVVIVPEAPDHEQQVRRLVDDVLPLLGR
jgi:5,10-methylenetetrahydromethanopterin reductase